MLITIACLIYLSALLPLLARRLKIPVLRRLSALQAKAFERITLAALSFSALCGLLIALVQMFTLITRNVFGVNYIAVQESLLYLFGAMFLLGGGGILLTDGHVRVDVLYSRWPAQRKRLVDILGLYLFLLPVCILIATAAYPYVLQSWLTLERSSEPSGIHAVFLLKSLVPMFAVFVAMAGIARLHKLLLDGEHV